MWTQCHLLRTKYPEIHQTGKPIFTELLLWLRYYSRCFFFFFSTVTEWIYSMVPYTDHPMSMPLILICSCCSVTQLCLTLLPHAPQHARLPCPSLSPRVCSNSCPLSRWCHPSISSSVTPFSSCPQSFPASGSFQMSQFFPSVGQNPCCPKDSHESSPVPQMI